MTCGRLAKEISAVVEPIRVCLKLRSQQPRKEVYEAEC